MTSSNRNNTYPEPLIIPPLRSHKQTFILLHGRGSNASKFGPELLSTPIPHPQNAGETVTLASAFPHARFVFPTASRRRATIYKRSIITQWFDNWELAPAEAPTSRAQEREREDLLIDGLRETSAYLHSLLRREIELLGDNGGAGNVVLGGLSQGCAASLIALLLWDGEPLAAAVGMCGWLPFRRQMEDIARGVEAVKDSEIEDEGFNPFASDSGDGDDDGLDPPSRAVAYLREELEIEGSSSSSSSFQSSKKWPFQRTPLFLGHGVEDGKVPVHLGREARSCLGVMGVDVSWKEYEGLGHWYSGEMLRDLVDFIRKRTGWE